MLYRILAVGDVVGQSGVRFLKKHLRRLKERYEIDFTVVNGENAQMVGLLPEDAVVGAGTVINSTQCESAIAAGAKFIVSPGFDNGVFDVCVKNDVPYIPGVVTPTEIMNAVHKGLTILKFFPAGVFGGLKALKAMSAAFPGIRFLPTGGVDESNAPEFLEQKFIVGVGGSWMMKGTTEDIENACRRAAQLVK